MADGETIRIAHFSDIHVSARPFGFRFRDFFTKRTTGWMSLRLHRDRLFKDAATIAAAMMRDIRERGCQHVVFSGDATSMGFEPEFKAAAECLGLAESRTDCQSVPLPGIAVPGNHDYYTRSAARAGYFERYFAAWQTGQRVGEHRYPFAQRVGHCWLIGVNSARSNFLVWDARGGVGKEQRARLAELLRGLAPGPRILVTHYPLYLADGTPETRWRVMRDWQPFRDLLVEHRISLWLHGHRHVGYVLEPKPSDHPFPIICAGSATQMGKWTWNEYLIDGLHLTMRRRSWEPMKERFVEATSCEFTLLT
jgi:3',5'-cyclic AMP phosphodiesterase CpdA